MSLEEPMEAAEEEFFPCPKCGGAGWVQETDHGYECYAAGECQADKGADCPIPVQVSCSSCGGHGYV